MAKVEFSRFTNGACPMCKHSGFCHILDFMENELEKVVNPVTNEPMEIVIYRCPEFKQEILDSDQ